MRRRHSGGRRALRDVSWALAAAIGMSLGVTPGRAQAAITFVSASSAVNASATPSETIAKPASVTSGELLVATVTAAGTGPITPPSGWTAIQDTTTTLRQVSYYHVAGTSEPSSWTWSLGSGRLASGGIIAYSGVNTTVPVDASAANSGASGNATAPSVTTNFAGDQVIVVPGYAASFPSGNSVTPASGTTERYDASTTGTESEAADFNQTSAGTTATKTATATVAGAWIAHTIALDPATAATLALSTSATPSFSASLPAGDQTPTYTMPLKVQDTRTATGARAGWNLTITSTQLKSGTHTLAATASQVTAINSACAGGASCTAPTNAITYPLSVPSGSTPPTAVKFYNAATATGTGIFTITPTVAVNVPANSYAGSYTSTLTVSLVSGP